MTVKTLYTQVVRKMNDLEQLVHIETNTRIQEIITVKRLNHDDVYIITEKDDETSVIPVKFEIMDNGIGVEFEKISKFYADEQQLTVNDIYNNVLEKLSQTINYQPFMEKVDTVDNGIYFK